MGTQVKLDIASPVIVPATSQWQIQHYEVAVNVRLLRRWYPTFELGYAGGQRTQDSISYRGQGMFFRLGCDLHPLKRHPEKPHALLIGVRLGTAIQDQTQQTSLSHSTANILADADRKTSRAGIQADCWGEIVAGCQVEIAKCRTPKSERLKNSAFYMGWMGRFKILFTRNTEDKYNNPYPIYIPGFGNRDNIGWGINYYLGWQF